MVDIDTAAWRRWADALDFPTDRGHANDVLDALHGARAERDARQRVIELQREAVQVATARAEAAEAELAVQEDRTTAIINKLMAAEARIAELDAEWAETCGNLSVRAEAAEAKVKALEESNEILIQDRDYTQGQFEAAQAHIAMLESRWETTTVQVLKGRIAAALELCAANDWCQECAVSLEIRRALVEGTP